MTNALIRADTISAVQIQEHYFRIKFSDIRKAYVENTQAHLGIRRGSRRETTYENRQNTYRR